MATLLYIEASPRKDRSASTQVARQFIDVYREKNPADQIDSIDLWAIQLPEFTGALLEAKYAILHGGEPSAAQRQGWRQVEEVISRFTRADKYLFSLPMWNFSIPYRLKHYLDILVQPGYTFSFSPEQGYEGLVQGKRAAAIYARGGSYPPGSDFEAYDLQKRYLETILGFIGISPLAAVVVEPTLGSPEEKEQALARAAAQARELAARF